MSSVEGLWLGSKLNQVIKWLLGDQSKDKVTSELLKSTNQEHGCNLTFQGVVTYMSGVEAFATGIKIESSDQSPFGGWSRNQGDLQTAKNQQWRMHGYNLTFDPWKLSDQEPQKGTIKQSSTLFADQKAWSRSQTLLRFWLRSCMSNGSWARRSRQTHSLLCSAILNWS